jgi:hypothetical protein
MTLAVVTLALLNNWPAMLPLMPVLAVLFGSGLGVSVAIARWLVLRRAARSGRLGSRLYRATETVKLWCAVGAVLLACSFLLLVLVAMIHLAG